MTAVKQNEIMKAVQGDNEAFLNLAFGEYSATKFHINQDGINVQPEAGAAVFTAAFAADPGRNGDAGSTVGTGTALQVDVFGRVTALGSLSAIDTTDVFTFAGSLGQRIIAEVFSQTLSDADGASANFVGRIANPLDPVIAIIDSLGNLVTGEEYNATSNLDGDANSNGDAGSDSLIYNFVLPANGLFGLRVTARGVGDSIGDYELLFIPEPTSAALLVIGMGLLVGWRRRRC
jgi:hypothetical protein